MANVFIINAHHEYPFAPGRLNSTLVEDAVRILSDKGYDTRVTNVDDGYDIENELANFIWSDFVILQSPVNWMMVPWTFKKYIDEVFSAGMSGALCDGDGRHRGGEARDYGTAGAMINKKYMLSLTLNAPKSAFDDESSYLFSKKNIDDLFFPMHVNFKFFGMSALPTFACYDVVKNPDIDLYQREQQKHLDSNF